MQVFNEYNTRVAPVRHPSRVGAGGGCAIRAVQVTYQNSGKYVSFCVSVYGRFLSVRSGFGIEPRG